MCRNVFITCSSMLDFCNHVFHLYLVMLYVQPTDHGFSPSFLHSRVLRSCLSHVIVCVTVALTLFLCIAKQHQFACRYSQDLNGSLLC